jgi:hypothetical protein
LASVGVVCTLDGRRRTAGGCVEECGRASMENVLHDVIRWLAVGRWLGKQSRGVTVVVCVVGIGCHVLWLNWVCDCRGVAK